MAVARRIVWAVAVAGALLAGCSRQAAIYTPSATPFVGDAPERERSEQIRRAGAGLGWVMEDVRPGLIRGTLSLRDHRAVVDVPYSRRQFSILYSASDNLRYDGGTIHGNYNGWVQRLEQAIVAQPAS